MSWIKWILAYVFDCVHPRTTWPHRDRRGFDYVCCLECGKELPYSTQRMRIVGRDALLADQRGAGWEEFGNAQCDVVGLTREQASRLDCTQALKEFVPSQLSAKGTFNFGKMQSTIWGVLHHTFAAAVAVFYSKSLLSAAIRALISL